MNTRYIGEHVALTRDCELGLQGEHAIVTELEGSYMTLAFKSGNPRTVHTGADYLYLRSAMRSLEWGGVIPENSPAAWGARAIYRLESVQVTVSKDGRRLKKPRHEIRATIDLLWDRKGAHGDADKVKLLCAWLDKAGIPELKKRCAAEHVTEDCDAVIEFGGAEFGGYRLRATPNESHGYLYIVAWSEMFIHPTPEAQCPACNDPKTIGHTCAGGGQ